MRAADDPTVSVIVPTYNRRTRLGRLLAALDRQHRSGVRFEVVIAVDGATDGTAEMLAGLRPSFPLEVIKLAQGGPAAARNAAIAAATGEVLLFLDDDVVPQDGLFERHLAVHRRDRSEEHTSELQSRQYLVCRLLLEKKKKKKLDEYLMNHTTDAHD